MHLEFQEIDKEQELHIVEIPDDNLVLEGEYLDGMNGTYVITGIATIDGERYHEFQIEFELEEKPEEETIECIMNSDWNWYDYVC